MSDHTSFLVGVDGGGSNCRVSIARADGSVIGTAKGAAANPSTAMDSAVQTLLSTLDAARVQARISTADLAQADAHFGLAGVINPSIARSIADAMPIDRIRVTDDRTTNMAGALGDADGFVAAIGTGSFLGAQAGGTQKFIGGWGFWLGDEASGAWIGRRLLTTVLHWQDGLRDASDLLTGALAGFSGDTGEIVLFARTATPQEFATLAPRVIAAAQAGDSAGLDIVRTGAAYMQTALVSLGHCPGDPLCLIGGLGPEYARFLDADFAQDIRAPRGSALDGALLLARRPAPDITP
ncbi:MAG: hypothetical protein LJE68_14700 [Rhodobacter sp.]|nr:hypothetical protein [Rhodobacter sp.]